MAKAYPDESPVKTSLDMASSVAATMKTAAVRKSHASVRDTYMVETKNRNVESATLEALEKLLDKAKRLDDTFSRTAGSAGSINVSSSIAALGQPELLRSQSSSSNSLFEVPTPQQHLDLPVVPAPQDTKVAQAEQSQNGQPSRRPSASEECDTNMEIEPDNKKKTKTLEDFETEAFQLLQARKQGSVMKRPGSRKSPQVFKRPGANSILKNRDLEKTATKAAASGSKKMTCWGCVRCRGNVHGCSSCAMKDFRGERLNGRDAWKKYMHKKGKL